MDKPDDKSPTDSYLVVEEDGTERWVVDPMRMLAVGLLETHDVELEEDEFEELVQRLRKDPE